MSFDKILEWVKHKMFLFKINFLDGLKLGWRRSPWMLLGMVMVLLGACGQTSPPSVTDLQDRLSDSNSYFSVTRPDGSTMMCNTYGDMSTNTQDSKSWFAYSCDWSGEYGDVQDR